VERQMGEKSLQKRKYILETARRVFMEKGYKRVTMKDIVEACEISRGGLYLYFNSTAEIFLEVLKLESQEADDVFSDSITEDATATDILTLFLKEQKKELLRKKDTLTQATYEFYFENELPKTDNILIFTAFMRFCSRRQIDGLHNICLPLRIISIKNISPPVKFNI